MAETATAGQTGARSPIDLRSDTVTQPCDGMRDAIRNAVVGDDGFRDDPTVLELEGRIAAMLHMDAALFVPSGVMANQIALRLHTRPGDEVIAHARSHVVHNEAGAPAAMAGVTLRLLESPDGCLYADDVHENLHVGEDGYSAPTSLICFENAHNDCGGVVVPQSNILGVAAFAHRRGLKLHLDGARLWNASVASNRSIGELAAPFDTVAVCLSKGLGAPVGSLLAGSQPLIARAQRLRRMMGGMMRQTGMLAAGCLYALDHNVERLEDDHRRAALLADELAEVPGISVGKPQTNIVYVQLPPGHPLRIQQENGGAGLLDLLRERGVLASGSHSRARLVTHLGIDDNDIDAVMDAFSGIFAPP